MSIKKCNLETNSKSNQPIICWNWHLESLNGDRSLDDEISQKYSDLRYELAEETEFPEETVVKYSIYSQEENVDNKNKEFFLKKLVKSSLSVSEKKQLLMDYFHQISGSIDETTEAMINHAIDYDVFEATSKSGKKYYLFEEFRLIDPENANLNLIWTYNLLGVDSYYEK